MSKRYENLQRSVHPVSNSLQSTAQRFSTTRSVPSYYDDAPELRPYHHPTPYVQGATQPNPSIQSASTSTQSAAQPNPSIQSASTSMQSAARRFSTTRSVPSYFDDAPELRPYLHPTPSVQGATQPNPSVQSASTSTQSAKQRFSTTRSIPELRPYLQPTQPTTSIQTTTESLPQVQAGHRAPSRIRRSRRVSMQHWTVEAIDSQGVEKVLRVKTRDVLNLSTGERIMVDFDGDLAVGEAQGLLARFCGLLAADCAIFPMHFEKWPAIPQSYFNRCFDQFIKPRFYFRTTESNARRYVYHSISKKWSAKRLKLFDKVYNPLKSRAEIMNSVPDGIPRDQWTAYVDYRFKPSTKETCLRNAEIRKLQTFLHIVAPNLLLD